MALGSVAPGIFSVSNFPRYQDIPFNISSLVPLELVFEQNFDFGFNLVRSTSIVEMEQLQQMPFGYNVEPNWLIGWPSNKTMDLLRNIEYDTDVLHFNFSCSWHAPQMGFFAGDTMWNASGNAWGTDAEGPAIDVPYAGGVLYLQLLEDDSDSLLSAYVFFGTNDSFPVNPNPLLRPIINLGNLPALVNTSGFQLVDQRLFYSTSHIACPLSSVLVCDPNAEISGGRVRLSLPQNLTVIRSGLQPIGNLPPKAAEFIFTQAMFNPTAPEDPTTNRLISNNSATLFLTDPSLSADVYPRGVPVHNLDTLNSNMNSFFLSASKSFLDGMFTDALNRTNVTFSSMAVNASVPVDELALQAERSAGLVVLGLCIAVVVVYVILVWLICVHHGDPFDLVHLIKYFDEESKRNERYYVR